jgi:hypothetical protein
VGQSKPVVSGSETARLHVIPLKLLIKYVVLMNSLEEYVVSVAAKNPFPDSRFVGREVAGRLSGLADNSIGVQTTFLVNVATKWSPK